MTSVEPVPHNRLTFSDAEVAAVSAVVASGYWAGGPQVAALELELAAAFGRRAAACVGSGLGALRLALKALGAGPGARVLVPGYSCVALPNAVAALGATPVVADIDPSTWTIAAGQADFALAVHTFGAPAEITALQAAGLRVVDDAAHGLPTGVAVADATVTSFYATKLIGGAEGGAVLSNDATLVASVREERDYTDKPPSGTRLNDKMHDLEAALTLVQLRRLDALLEARRRLADRYTQRLAGVPTIALPAAVGGRVWYRYAVESLACPAAELSTRLRRHGVVTELPVTDWRDDAQREATPVSTRAYERLLSLPLYPTLSDAEQDRVITALEQEST